MAPRTPSTIWRVRYADSGLAVSYWNRVNGISFRVERRASTKAMPPKAATTDHGTSLRTIFVTRTPNIARIVTKNAAVAT